MYFVSGFYSRRGKPLKGGKLRKTALKPVSGQTVVSWTVGPDSDTRYLLRDQNSLIRKLRGWCGRAAGLGGLKGKDFPFL